MVVQILRKNLASAITVCVLLILLLFTFVAFVFLKDLTTSVKENKFRYEQANRSNLVYLEQVELKGELSRVIKDVNYTTLLTLDYVADKDQLKKSRRIKVWSKRITPLLDTLDKKIDKTSSDVFKKSFTRIYDEVKKNRILQEQLILKSEDTIVSHVEISAVKRSAEKLSENHSSFLASKPEKDIIRPEPVHPIGDNFIKIVVISIIVVALIILIVNLLINYLSVPINKINKYISDLKNGDFPDDISTQIEDYKLVMTHLKSIKSKFSEIKTFSELVAQNKYEGQDSIKFEREGEIGIALVQMQNNLERRAIEDNQRNHINQGLARFSEILSNYTNDLEKFGDVVLKDLVEFLNANQGAMFVIDDEIDELKMVSCYAYHKKKYLNVSIKKGQGLVGQAWQEVKSIHLTEIPENYVTITSGLGESTPRSILVVPLVFNEEVQGIIELASFNEFEEYEMDFVEKVSESISAALSSVKINTKTQTLLEESSNLTKQMKEQEDLMKVKVDDLNQIQAESREREAEYLKEINRLKKKIETYERSF